MTLDKKDPVVKELMALTVIQTFAMIKKIVKDDYNGSVTLKDLTELQKEIYKVYKKRGLVK